MIIPEGVTFYIKQYENKEIVLNKERIQLFEFLRKKVFSRNDLYFNEKTINNCYTFIEKYYFPLQPFQKFIIPFFFLYYIEDDEVFFDEFLIMMARGGGKNGLISALTHFFISDLHGIENYNVSLVANSEKQAKTSFNEVYSCIKKHSLQDFFYAKKTDITGIDTESLFQFHTNNAGTKDGLRDACVIFDEVHQYENNKLVDVFTSGLGKIKNSREIYIGTDGYVRGGFLDRFKERAKETLECKDDDTHLFPFICKIDIDNEMNDETVWEKAQPMFHKPLCSYAKTLLKKVRRQYVRLETEPSGLDEFLTKRMNLPRVESDKVVAPWEQIVKTNKPFPDLKGRECIGGLDYASIRDFVAVGLLFKYEGNYVYLTHSFARLEYLQTAQLKPPIFEWAEQGLLTIVDEPSIDPQHVIDWFNEKKQIYDLKKVVGDNFRMDLLKPLFKQNDIDYEIIRNPRAIHSLLAPKVEDAFANERIIWGDNPLMRWYTNNVSVKITPQGNKEYVKKDEHRRKTDGFQSFVHALYKSDELSEINIENSLDFLNDLYF